jgi:hypothetical protein
VVMDDENGGFRDGVGGDDHVGREMTVLWGSCRILDTANVELKTKKCRKMTEHQRRKVLARVF